MSEQPVLKRVKNAANPEGIERVILKAMAENPEEWFGNMQELGEVVWQGDVKALRSGGDATVRMDSGMSRERMMVERTASLAMGGSGQGRG